MDRLMPTPLPWVRKAPGLLKSNPKRDMCGATLIKPSIILPYACAEKSNSTIRSFIFVGWGGRVWHAKKASLYILTIHTSLVACVLPREREREREREGERERDLGQRYSLK